MTQSAAAATSTPMATPDRIGFGWFGRVSLTLAVAAAVAFFMLRLFLSRLWLSRAAFGPAEWLWRMSTYRRRFPLRR